MDSVGRRVVEHLDELGHLSGWPRGRLALSSRGVSGGASVSARILAHRAGRRWLDGISWHAFEVNAGLGRAANGLRQLGALILRSISQSPP